MQSLEVSPQISRTRRVYQIGFIFVLVGGLVVGISSFFPWQVQVCTNASSVLPYYGGILGLPLGGVAGLFGALAYSNQEHPSAVGVGGFLGWWIPGCLAFGIIALDDQPHQIAFLFAGVGMGTSFLGGMLVSFTSRLSIGMERFVLRQWLAVLALFFSLSIPGILYLAALLSPPHTYPLWIFPVAIGLLLISEILAIVAVRGEVGMKLGYPYRIISGFAMSFIPAIVIDVILLFQYNFQHFLGCSGGSF